MYFSDYMKDAENFKETLQKEDLEPSAQRKTLFKLEQILIAIQEVGYQKVEIGQHILDLIDNKYRSLDQDLRKLGAAGMYYLFFLIFILTKVILTNLVATFKY